MTMWLSVVCAALSSASMALVNSLGSDLRAALIAGGIRPQPGKYLAWLALGVVLVTSTIGALPLFGGTENVFTSLAKLAIVLWLPHLLVAALNIEKPQPTTAE